MAVGERERERGALNTGFVAAPGMSGAARVAGIVAAPLALAALGLTHPVHLDGDTALWWHQLHIVLLPLFPLLGVNLWWLLAGLTGPLPWVGRIAGFVYIVFYGAPDVLAGIAAGVVRERATQEGVPAALAAEGWLFTVGNALADVGVWAFLLGCILASGLLYARLGRRALPGALCLCVAAVIFLQSHIYFPLGVVAMLLLAAGFGLLQWVRITPARG